MNRRRSAKPISLFLIFLCFGAVLSLYAEGRPYVLAVPAIRSGPDELARWEPIVAAVSSQSSLDIRLNIERSQEEVMERLRTRRADAGVLDSVAAYALIREITALPIGMIGNTGAKRSYQQQFAIIVPAQSLTFDLAQIGDEDITVVDVSVYPAMAALTTLLFADLDVAEPRFSFVDTETSILKGTAYGWNNAGVVSEDLLLSPAFEDYVQNVRVIARSEVVPSWFIVVRPDSRWSDHESIRLILQDISAMETTDFSVLPIVSADYLTDGEKRLLQRAVHAWRSLHVVAD